MVKVTLVSIRCCGTGKVNLVVKARISDNLAFVAAKAAHGMSEVASQDLPEPSRHLGLGAAAKVPRCLVRLKQSPLHQILSHTQLPAAIHTEVNHTGLLHLQHLEGQRSKSKARHGT